MKTTKTAMILFLFLGLMSCKKGGVFCYREKGNMVTETRNHSGFSEIALAEQGVVYVTQGPEYSVEVEAAENILKIIETEVQGNTLVIKKKKGKCISGSPTINIYVTSPNISGLEISGSGKIYGNGLINTSNMDLLISGSGDIILDELSATNLETDISGSGNIRVGQSDTLNTHDITISGSGNIECYGAISKSCDVNISGSGNCEVNAIDELNINISGSGNVFYMGSPVVTTNISGSGDVHHN